MGDKVLSLQKLKVQSNSQAGKSIESGLRDALRQAHGDSVRNVFMSNMAGACNVWIDNKVDLDALGKSRVELTARNFLRSFYASLHSFDLLNTLKLPSTSACMQLIKIHAPIQFPRIKSELELSGYQMPSDTWLARRLDCLRKRGLLMRLRSGAYVLTGHAFRQTGIDKDAKSSDLSRLLQLARRGR